ncbi:hypothetical protein [Corallococcus sp. Z5C101001]|nr:hypothetical protein [Corallococcus sp. Z5C101001]
MSFGLPWGCVARGALFVAGRGVCFGLPQGLVEQRALFIAEGVA